MKYCLTILIVIGGLAAGWMLPSPRHQVSHAPLSRATAVQPVSEHAHRARTRELLNLLLDESRLGLYQRRHAASLAALLGAIRKSGNFDEEDVQRIIEMDPVSAMEHLLIASRAWSLGSKVANAWGSRDPQAAIKFLLKKTSYRADGFLCQALVGACAYNPQLVAETIRAKPRGWQLRNLKDLFSQKITIPTGIKRAVPSGDPFADDGSFRTCWFGQDILDCLADDELRDKVRACWKDDPFQSGTTEKKPEAVLDLTKYGDGSSSDLWKLQDLLRDHRQETLGRVAEQGNFQARAAAMSYLMCEFPNDPKRWSEGYKQLEAWMKQLDVIPDYPPMHFEMGPFLKGPEAAAWIASQPLALQRAWSATFTETWACSEPEAAIHWARELPSGAAGEEAVQRGLIVWAHTSPLEAAAYVADLPPGDLREAAISNTAASWACIDRSAAAAWLAKLPDSPGKTRAIERVK